MSSALVDMIEARGAVPKTRWSNFQDVHGCCSWSSVRVGWHENDICVARELVLEGVYGLRMQAEMGDRLGR